ncbi:Crp/Fnr family transcriptional regulator [Pilimelia anulata]|uniref:Crp/Fnr family transcriptional regulator n=1 Tax=Pilimelia anulata TaxID=53371 RepID=A0A8J3B9K5_9ACTN|nr:family 2B encapsulin nanocompartment shell protein [Pilimelia anulata]GGK05445.1 Crp/Fnr family transcriptional regulator [Pilimelia anulata]
MPNQDTPDTSAATTPQQRQRSLSTAAARNLATTTKTVPQMQEITSRWLLKVLPWVQVSGGSYRVNRRLSYAIGDGRISFTNTGATVRVVPPELTELPALRGYADEDVLSAMADRFTQHEYGPGDVVATAGADSDDLYLLAHGKVNKVRAGQYDDEAVLAVLADGDYFGDESLTDEDALWDATYVAATRCTLLRIRRDEYLELVARSDSLRAHLDHVRELAGKPQNKHGEAAIEIAAGHDGEPRLPETFVDYEAAPREYELSVAQTVLRVHSRVADLYSKPMNQVEQQLRLTIEALKERQEHELVNNREFGLLHNADLKQRIHTRSGPPTPDDLDEILSRRRKSQFFLAHPRAIAAFGRECSRRGLYPDAVDFHGHKLPAWRGVPLLPCNKIPISDTHTTSIMVMRTGEDDQGVVGLHQTGLPDEYEPSLSVRFMGIDDQATISYLVSAYYSAAVLVPDALGVLEDVELGHY